MSFPTFQTEVGTARNSTSEANRSPIAQTPNIQSLLFLMRAVPLALTFVAACTMGSAKQIVDISDYSFRQAESVMLKYADFNDLKYFIAIVALSSLLSLILSIPQISSSVPNLELSISVEDIFALAFLLTCNGSAITTNKDILDISETCSAFGKFCAMINASVVLLFFAAGVYIVVMSFTLVRFYDKQN